MKISGVVITLNEEEKIQACIESLMQVCSEVIVLDSFSTDRTVEIAKECGASVHQYAWQGYAATKNKANQLAQGNYILSLDADEVLSSELISSIHQLNEENDTAFTMNRRNRFEGRWMYHTGWYPDKKLRLFPKKSARWEGDFVHEELVVNPGLQIQHLKGDILHYSADDSTGFYNRNKKYALLRVQEKMENGGRMTWTGSLLSAIAEFIKRFFLQMGLMDGIRGLKLSWMHAKLKMARYSYYRAIKKGLNPN
jgi:glycosyltransferase involved in cell wall biosynthesis